MSSTGTFVGIGIKVATSLVSFLFSPFSIPSHFAFFRSWGVTAQIPLSLSQQSSLFYSLCFGDNGESGRGGQGTGPPAYPTLQNKMERTNAENFPTTIGGKRQKSRPDFCNNLGVHLFPDLSSYPLFPPLSLLLLSISSPSSSLLFLPRAIPRRREK